MKIKLLLILMLGMTITYFNSQIVSATTYHDEVQIYFENETFESSSNTVNSTDRELIKEKPNHNDISKLPQLGQMITSIIVLLIGIILVLLVIMLYLIRKINLIKTNGG